MSDEIKFTAAEMFEWARSKDVIPGQADSWDVVAHNANKKISALSERLNAEINFWKKRAAVHKCIECGNVALTPKGGELLDENEKLRKLLDFAHYYLCHEDCGLKHSRECKEISRVLWGKE